MYATVPTKFGRRSFRNCFGKQKRFPSADGSYRPRDSFCCVLYRTDPLCGGRHCVIAKMHRSRPRMVGAANKCELDPALSGDALDNPQRLAEFLQDWPLLNVQFNVPQRPGAYTSAETLI